MHRPKLLLSLTLLLPLPACELESVLELDRDGMLAPSGERADDAREHGHHPPPHELLLHAAVEVGDLGEHPQMQPVLEQRREAHEEARLAHQTLGGALADAVAAGSVDAGAFDGEIAGLVRAAGQDAVALGEALDVAHALLDEAERGDVVDMLPPPPKSPEGPPPAGARPGPGPGGPGPLLVELGLDEAQQQALREALGEPERPGPPAPIDLASFADEGFSASALGLVTLHEEHAGRRAQHEARLVAALVPLLDDEQRGRLEQLLRDGPPRPEGPTREPA